MKGKGGQMSYKKQGFLYCGQMNATQKTIEKNARTKCILVWSILIIKEPNDLFCQNLQATFMSIFTKV
jgi:hypothetical protein